MSLVADNPINVVSGSPFNSIHDSCQGPDFVFFVIKLRSENQVHVIRHYDANVQPDSDVAIVAAALQHNVSCGFW